MFLLISGVSLSHPYKHTTCYYAYVFNFSFFFLACPVAALAGGLCLSLEGHYTLLH